MVESKIASADQAKAAASDDEKSKAAAAAEAVEEKHPGKGLFVLYLGPRNAARAAEADEFKSRAPRLGEGTKAEMTAAQWAELGCGSESKRTHTWDLSNNWQIPATQFTDDQIGYMLTYSKRFELVDSKGQKVDL